MPQVLSLYYPPSYNTNTHTHTHTHTYIYILLSTKSCHDWMTGGELHANYLATNKLKDIGVLSLYILTHGWKRTFQSL